MKNVKIACDRCGFIVQGIIYETPLGVFTGGFYNVAEGYWSRFARWEEEKICDKCMHSCKKYQKNYGTSALSGSPGL
jgi:hypothetical protein